MKNYLINEDLFRENVKDYENFDLDYKRSPDTVGIKSEISNSKRKYIVYSTDERGSIDFTKDFVNFDEALEDARELYKALISYYRTMVFDMAKINKKKYFTKEIISEIYKKLREIGIDIDELPVLGTSIQYGPGCICLEEDNGIFNFYILDRASKFELEQFDNIEVAIDRLVLCYKDFGLVDDTDKMKEIFYQVLGLNHQNKSEIKLVKKKS